MKSICILSYCLFSTDTTNKMSLSQAPCYEEFTVSVLAIVMKK